MHISTSSKIFFNCLLHRLTKTWNRGRPETKINIVSENCTIQFAILVHAFVILLKQSISRMRTKNFLLKETEGFPQWTAPFTYCHSLFLNQFSLFSKASPSHCDLMYRPFGTNTFPYFSVVSFSTSISSSLSSISKSSSSVVHLFLSSESSATSLPVLSSADSPCFSPVGDSCVK